MWLGLVQEVFKQLVVILLRPPTRQLACIFHAVRRDGDAAKWAPSSQEPPSTGLQIGESADGLRLQNHVRALLSGEHALPMKMQQLKWIM